MIDDRSGSASTASASVLTTPVIGNPVANDSAFAVDTAARTPM